MTTLTLFGIPLFGTLFAPLIIGLVTILFFWTLLVSRNSFRSTAKQGKTIQKISFPREKVVLETNTNAKDKGKKKCGSSGGCCGKKDGKSGGCSELSQAILSAKVFLDRHSNICQELADTLAKQLTETIATELINIPPLESMDLTTHADGSLCIFIIDTSISNGEPHWLPKALHNLANTGKPLSLMKYSVFTVQAVPLEPRVDTLDQMLHRSGAVRVCRAQAADITAALPLNHFDEWAEEVLSQIQRWNSPSKKSCKCVPKKKKVNEENDSCSSSNCSSENEETNNSSTPKPILDLEDIAKLL